MKKEELDKFLQNKELKRVGIYEKYKAEILYLRENRATLDVVLEYLFEQDISIKNKYSNSEKSLQAAKSLLSKTIKKWRKNEEKTSIKVAPEEPKKTPITTTKEEEKVAPKEPEKEKVTLDNFGTYQAPVTNKYDKYRKG